MSKYSKRYMEELDYLDGTTKKKPAKMISKREKSANEYYTYGTTAPTMPLPTAYRVNTYGTVPQRALNPFRADLGSFGAITGSSNIPKVKPIYRRTTSLEDAFFSKKKFGNSVIPALPTLNDFNNFNKSKIENNKLKIKEEIYEKIPENEAYKKIRLEKEAKPREYYEQTAVKNYNFQQSSKKGKESNFSYDKQYANEKNIYKEISEKEKNIYNYFVGAGKRFEAEKYIGTIKNDLVDRRAKKDAGNYSFSGSDNAFIRGTGSTIDSINAGIVGGIKGIEYGLNRLLGNAMPADKNYTVAKNEYMLDSLDNGTQRVFGEIANTIGYMLPAVASNIALPGSGIYVNALSSGGNSYQEALTEGKSQGEALTYAIVNGTLEGVTQKLIGGIKSLGSIGLSKLPVAQNMLSKTSKTIAKNPTLQNALLSSGKYLAEMGDEGMEEYLQANINPIVRNVIFDEKNEINPFTQDKLYSALLGAFTAGIMNAPYAVSGMKNNVKTNKANSKANQTNSSSIAKEIKNVNFTTNEADNSIKIDGTNISVGQEYSYLSEQAPELFPTEITEPMEQVKTILKVKEDFIKGEQKNVADVGKKMNVEVEFTDKLPQNVNGKYENGRIYISNKSQNPTMEVFKHELTHHIESSENYDKFSNFVMKDMTKNGFDVDNMIKETVQNYKDAGFEIDDNGAKKEIIAEFVGENLFTDDKEIARLTEKAPNFAKRIYNWIKDTLHKFTNSKEQSVLTTAMQKYEKAFRTIEESKKKDTQYQLIGTNKQGTPMYKSDFDENIAPNERKKIFKERVATVFNLGQVEKKTDNKKITVFGDRFTFNKNIFGDSVPNKSEKNAKMNSLYDLVDILEKSKFIGSKIEDSYADESKKPKNKAHVGVKYWHKFGTEIILDDVKYKVVFNVRDKGKEQFVYLVEFKEIEDSNVSHTVNKNNLLRTHSNPLDNTLPQNKSTVNSIRESNKNDTKVQQSKPQYSIKIDEKTIYTPAEAIRIRKDAPTFKNLVIGFDTSIKEFFNKWKNGKKQDEKFEKLYMGKISGDVAAKVKEVVGYDVSGRDFIIANSDIAHIYSHHGNIEGEKNRGQTGVNENLIEIIPDIVNIPDNIYLDSTNERKRDGIVFEKNIGDGLAVYIQVDNSGRRTLQGKTFYVKKIEDTPAMGYPLKLSTLTSESDKTLITTTPVSSDNMLAQKEGDVNIGNKNDTKVQHSVNVEFGKGFREYSSRFKKSGDFGKEVSKESSDKSNYSGNDNAVERAKAVKYETSKTRNFADKISEIFSIPKNAKKDTIIPIAQQLAKEYKEKGFISAKAIDELFTKAFDEGVVILEDYYNKYKGVKDEIRNTKLSISETDKSSIADFNSFRKGNFGTLKIVNEGGIPVDSKYMEWVQQYPELFSDDIINVADQLIKISEVAKGIEKTDISLKEHLGEEAKFFKADSKAEFEKAINEFSREMDRVIRYNNDNKKETHDFTNISVDTVKELSKKAKVLKRNMDKVKDSVLLTNLDQKILKSLLDGTYTTDDIPKRADKEKIMQLYKACMPYYDAIRPVWEYNKQMKEKLHKEAVGLLENADTWNDKKIGFNYSRETVERNIRDIVPNKGEAEKIIDYLFEPIHANEAKNNRMKVYYKKLITDLNISTKEKYIYKIKGDNKPMKCSESTFIQLLGEGKITLSELESVEGIKKETIEKIDKGTKVFRKIYNELFDLANDVLIKNGYEPIDYRRNYFPHFTEYTNDNVLWQIGAKLGFDVNMGSLPTAIAGTTDTRKPGKNWVGNFLTRVGDTTEYNALKGFDKYILGASDVIHHTDDIQRLRAFENAVRYQYSKDGIKEKVDKAKADPTLSEEDRQNRINEAYNTKIDHLPNFVTHIRTYTDLLAGKNQKGDRWLESEAGRFIYSLSTKFFNRVGANMVGANIGSAFTQFVPLTQTFATTSSKNMLMAMYDVINGVKKHDGFIEKSIFLTNRHGTDNLYKTKLDNFSDKASYLFTLFDDIVSETIVRAKYYEGIEKGLGENVAMKKADRYSADIMADRSKGAVPTFFQMKNPLAKMFTQFQLEVHNTYSNLTKDLPREVVEKGRAGFIYAMMKYCIAAYAFDKFYEWFFGRTVTLNPIGTTEKILEHFTNEDMTKGEATLTSIKGLGEQLPFIGGLLGGGRVPIGSALPDVAKLFQLIPDTLSGQMNTKKGISDISKELSKPMFYVLPPFGGGQAKKTIEGAITAIMGGSYGLDKDGNKTLQFPIINNNAFDTVINTAKAVTFGKYSLPTAKDYINSGFKSFNAEQTKAYDEAIKNGASKKVVLEYFTATKNLEGTKEKSVKQQKIDFLNEFGFSAKQKYAFYENGIFSKKQDDDEGVKKENSSLSEMEKACNAIKSGISKEEYVDFYEKKLKFKSDDVNSLNDKIVREIQKMKINTSQLYVLLNDEIFSKGQKEKFAEYMKNGMTKETIAEYYSKTYFVKDKEMKKKVIDKLNLDEKQSFNLQYNEISTPEEKKFIKEMQTMGYRNVNILKLINKYEEIKDKYKNENNKKIADTEFSKYLDSEIKSKGQKTFIDAYFKLSPYEYNEETLSKVHKKLYSYLSVKNVFGGNINNFIKASIIIDKIKADKDEYGNSISGTAKEKEINMIKYNLKCDYKKAEDIYNETVVFKHDIEELSSSARRKLEAAQSQGMSEEKFLKCYNANLITRGVKGKNGRTINGSRKANLIKALKAIGLSESEAIDFYYLMK